MIYSDIYTDKANQKETANMVIFLGDINKALYISYGTHQKISK